MIGGRVGLALEPRLLELLATGRRIAVVSGTNGKTTTTRLLAEALGGLGRVATSAEGANMTAGIVSALAAEPQVPAVLEVDEAHLEGVVRDLHPAVVVLLNLSRDQLDRVNEVRLVASRWRRALEQTSSLVVANADDPLVVYAAETAHNIRYVGAGGLWRFDAHDCPHCSQGIEFHADGSWSSPCGFVRPALFVALLEEELVLDSGKQIPLELRLPGRFNLANAAMAAVAAEGLGVEVADAVRAIAGVEEIAGRFARYLLGETEVRLLLAKNPAGWTELIGLLSTETTPAVIGINARSADGRDPSWLWDVPFENLAGRHVVATGERWRDLAVRLRHAGVVHESCADPLDALGLASGPVVEFVGNYTSFQDVRRSLRGRAQANRHLAGTGRSALAQDVAAAGAVSTRPTASDSALRIVVVHPDLLGTYGDGGNGLILLNRARWRGIEAELVLAESDEVLPRDGDLYCLGGGEDSPQVHAANRLGDGSLAAAVERGAVVLAICAGYQILGRSFPGSAGEEVRGLGLLDIKTVKGVGRRAVGELAIEAVNLGLALSVSTLSGFENHAGHTTVGSGARPLGRVLQGIGNGAEPTDGAVSGRIIGSYLHGPVLARNPGLADHLLGLATGEVLAPLDDNEEEALRAERLGAALSGPARRLALGRLRPKR